MEWDKCKIEGDISLMHALTRGQRMRWHNAENDAPLNDGVYITLIKTQDGKHIVEIAPWISREYQGSHKMGCYFGIEHATHWMQLPELPTENDDCDE